MLTVTLSHQILRLVETGIENAIRRYITADIETVEPCIENAKSHLVSADIEAC